MKFPTESATRLKAGCPMAGMAVSGLVVIDDNGLTPERVDEWIRVVLLTRTLRKAPITVARVVHGPSY